MMIQKLLLLFFAAEGPLLLSACGRDLPLQAAFREDSDYFLGLASLRSGNDGDAKRLFLRCSERGSPLCARRSLEMIAEIGTDSERKDACGLLVSRYGDDEALLCAAREYASGGEYPQILKITDGLNPSSDSALFGIRIDALRRTDDPRYRRELYAWFLERPLDGSHYNFFKSHREDFDVPAEGAESDEARKSALQNAAVRLRIEVFRRNYGAAFQLFKSFRNALPLSPYIVSDMGKACLYGSGDNVQNALFFDSLAARADGTGAAFYSLFYAGRLYDAAAGHGGTASDRYRGAMEAAQSDENYDNALWYLLSAAMRRSLDDAASEVKSACRTWRSPDYFDDLLETLSQTLLSARRWNDFSELYKALCGHASGAMTAKYAYIYGRLVQEGLSDSQGGAAEQEAAAEAFRRALSSGGDPYYRVMAIHRLGLGESEAKEALCNVRPPKELPLDSDAERLLLGYAAFGLPDMIYPEWTLLSRRGSRISLDSAMKIASFLNGCGETMNEYYPQALRLAVRAISAGGRPITPDDLRLAYPKDFKRIVEENCARFEVPEEILYALIRSESFFDSQVESAAGAVGLTQLMAPTAGDVARKLKYDSYDLKDAAMNVEFGAHYIAELSRRLEDAWLPAFFAYNAGISRVRRWMDARTKSAGPKPLPIDLFLETIPYQETRGYGQKLIGASAMYGWLYFGKSVSEVVSALLAEQSLPSDRN